METDLRLGIGQRIKEIRLRKKLTQNDVVGEYMTRNMLSKIENGSAAPSVKTLEYLSKALDVPMSYFLDLDDAGKGLTDTKQLAVIEELADELMETDPGRRGLAMCIKARAMMAAGRANDALALFGEFRAGDWPSAVLPHIYMILEDCHREKGDYKLAYEYALKRLGDN